MQVTVATYARPTSLHLTPAELVASLREDTPWMPCAPSVVVVPADEPWPELDPRLSLVSVVIVGVTETPRRHPADVSGAAWCDLVIGRSDPALELIAERVEATPIAATALVQLLRGAEGRSISDGLLLESAVYSTLQSGPEFARWRASRPRKDRVPSTEPVLVERSGSHLTITLNRPHVRNALDRTMRDALVDAFRLVAVDDSIENVTLRGAGRDYSSGGDLDEFGSFSDPSSAHLIRLTASIGRAIASVAARVHVELHGACMGSGIELPAFAGTIAAAEDTRIALPELGLGLVPGAGGTWSVTSRIGRHRTAELALTGRSIDAVGALEWGLIDEIRAV
jgi:hypothetical protein